MSCTTNAPSQPLLIGRLDAARLMGVSHRTWDRLADSGKTPAPLRLGSRPMWRFDDLQSWIEAGCPDRRTWEALKAQGAGGKR